MVIGDIKGVYGVMGPICLYSLVIGKLASSPMEGTSALTVKYCILLN